MNSEKQIHDICYFLQPFRCTKMVNYARSKCNRWLPIRLLTLAMLLLPVALGKEIRNGRRKSFSSREDIVDRTNPRNSGKGRKTWTPSDDLLSNSKSGRVAKESRQNSFSRIFKEKFEKAYSALLGEIRPLKNVWDGFQSAYQLIWTGYYEGFSGFVFEYPWEGFTRDGFSGLVYGTCAGAVHFTSMTTSGIIAGLYQALRGFEHSYYAIQAESEGKIWDENQKQWIFYSLDQHIEELQSSTKTRDRLEQTRLRKRKSVKDSLFYDRLEIAVDASSAEIKRAYYQQALNLHPDKNSNSEASENFRDLNLAYKTLISAETRTMYDAHGVCFADLVPSENSARVDPYNFFEILFGTSAVGMYVGDLALASLVDHTLQLTNRAAEISPGKSIYSSAQQARREVGIASHLRERITNVTTGKISYNDFVHSCQRETESLFLATEKDVEAEFLMEAIGAGIISATADHVVSTWMKPLTGIFSPGLFDAVKDMKAAYDLEKSIKKVLIGMDSSVNGSGSGRGAEECNSKTNAVSSLDDMLKKLTAPEVLKLVWRFNARDIARTLREACKRVLEDCGADSTLRTKKAKALNALGRAFSSSVKKGQDRKRDNSSNYPGNEITEEVVKVALFRSIINEGFVE